MLALSIGLPIGARAAVSPSIDAGQVQKRIPQPNEEMRPLPQLRLPAPSLVTPLPAAPLHFVLTGVVIEGATIFSAADLAPVYEHYLAREINLGDIRKILDAITNKYRESGYFLSRAVAPRQPLGLGILRIKVIEGYVRQVMVRGASPGEDAQLAPYFATVLAQHPLQLSSLERALLLVNDLPGLRVAPKLRPIGKESAAYDLILTRRRQRLSGYVSLDNRGSDSLGPWQAQVTGGVNSVFRDFDRLQLSVFDTPNDPAELLSTDLLYDTPLGHAGMRLALSVARTHLLPGGNLTPQDYKANAMRYAAQLSYPLLRGRDQSLWLGTSFDLLDSWERSAGLPLFDDHLRVMHGTATYTRQDSSGDVSRADIELSQGLSFLGASHPGGVELSRSNGRADFTKVSGSVTQDQVLTRHWGAEFAVAGQKSAEPLLLAEQFALGSVPFGRGYDPAEIAGDDAVASTFELRYGRFVGNSVLRSYQLYGFYDFGMVWNMEATNGILGRQSLASLGGGVRFALVHGIYANIEIAKPLTRRVAAANGKPVRVFVSLSAPF